MEVRYTVACNIETKVYELWLEDEMVIDFETEEVARRVADRMNENKNIN